MSYQLNFTDKHRYETTEVGITIPFSLKAGDIIVEGYRKVDTGAEFCLFQREHADEMGLDVESGRAIRLSTLSGSLEAFGHRLLIQTFDLAFESTLYFAGFYGLNRNILGRKGWLEHLDFGLTMRSNTIYLGMTKE